MSTPPLTQPIASAVADFFDRDRRPSHHDLDLQFARAGLEEGDPQRLQPGLSIGKRKRVFGILTMPLTTIARPERGSSLGLLVWSRE